MITSEEIRQLSDDYNISLIAAKNILVKKKLLRDCENASSLDELKDVVFRLIRLS